MLQHQRVWNVDQPEAFVEEFYALQTLAFSLMPLKSCFLAALRCYDTMYADINADSSIFD